MTGVGINLHHYKKLDFLKSGEVDGSTEVDGPNAEKIGRAKLKHSFQLARVKGRHR